MGSMRRLPFLFLILAAVLAAVPLITLAQQVTSSGPGAALSSNKPRYPITHIVIIDKENRSFDNLFGTFPQADGATHARISTGKVISLNHTPDHTLLDIGHAGDSATLAVDQGRMDHFD